MFWMWRIFKRVGGWRAIVADAALAWRLFKDPRVGLMPKLLFPAVVIYFLSPINLPFEWIPIIGQVDDIGVALLALGAFLKLCPPHLVAEHARALEAEFGRPERYGRFGSVGRHMRPRFDKWTGGVPHQPASRARVAEVADHTSYAARDEHKVA